MLLVNRVFFIFKFFFGTIGLFIPMRRNKQSQEPSRSPAGGRILIFQNCNIKPTELARVAHARAVEVPGYLKTGSNTEQRR